MGLSRLLLLLLIIGGIWLLYKRVKRFVLIQRDNPASRTPTQVNMVRCQYCGIHIPERDAVIRQGKIYCSLAHADKHHRA
jgi:uncharacterized protein